MINKFLENVCNFLNFNSDNSKEISSKFSKENFEENFKDVLEILKTEYNLESERTKSIEKKSKYFFNINGSYYIFNCTQYTNKFSFK